MSLIATQQASNFVPMPEGLNQAVISEVKDLGKQKGPYGEKDTVVLRFTNAAGEEASKFVSPSLHEKANLTKIVKALLGEVPATLDMTSLVGTPCQVLITHQKHQTKGTTIAKIESVLKAAAGQKAFAVAAKPKAAVPNAAPVITDADIDF